MNQTLLATQIANRVIKDVTKELGTTKSAAFIQHGLHFSWWKDDDAIYVEVRNENGELLEVRQPL